MPTHKKPQMYFSVCNEIGLLGHYNLAETFWYLDVHLRGMPS